MCFRCFHLDNTYLYLLKVCHKCFHIFLLGRGQTWFVMSQYTSQRLSNLQILLLPMSQFPGRLGRQSYEHSLTSQLMLWHKYLSAPFFKVLKLFKDIKIASPDSAGKFYTEKTADERWVKCLTMRKLEKMNHTLTEQLYLKANALP